MKIEILGPYDFLPFQIGGKSLYGEELTVKPGIYFWAFQIEGEYWINYIGISESSIAKRQSGHLSKFLSAEYDVYNYEALMSGRIEKAYTPSDGREKFKTNLNQLEKVLQNLSFYFAPIETETSILKRIETAFICRYRESGTDSKILDNGNVSRYRRQDEEPVHLEITFPKGLKGMPSSLIA